MTIIRHITRWAGIAALTITAAIVAYYLAEGTLQALHTCNLTADEYELGLTCAPPSHSMMQALSFLGASFAFWFSYTGRFARLFRKV